MGAAIKALSQQMKASGADVGIGVATMLGFEDTVKLFRVRSVNPMAAHVTYAVTLSRHSGCCMGTVGIARASGLPRQRHD